MENNFKCKKCGNEFYVSSYKVVIGSEKKSFFDKRFHKIICPKCKNEEIIYLQGKTNFKTINIGKFNSLSGQEKRIMLKKRAHEHHLKHDMDLVKYKNGQAEDKLLSKIIKK